MSRAEAYVAAYTLYGYLKWSIYMYRDTAVGQRETHNVAAILHGRNCSSVTILIVFVTFVLRRYQDQASSAGGMVLIAASLYSVVTLPRMSFSHLSTNTGSRI